MDYYDEDPRPRFQVQKSLLPVNQNHENSHQVDKKQATFCIAAGILIFSYGCLLSGIWQMLLTWIGVSLVIGPFAPISVTGGDITVGAGDPLEEQEDPQIEPPTPQESERKNHRAKNRRSQYPIAEIPISNEPISGPEETMNTQTLDENSRVSRILSDEEWSPEDVDLLKKLLVKNPPGKPGRWEVIADAFEGTRTVDSVIKKAKSLGEKKPGDEDSYTKFLAQRKVSDRPVELERNGEGFDLVEVSPNLEDKLEWSAADDRALLNALKAFPKDTNMRWEKIAAAVPGKSKPLCVKRFSELKQNFRNSKASES